jgi:hypothetical protein
LRKFCYPHDIIENYCTPQVRIIEIIAPLYKENLSITEIAERTGFKRTMVWETLKQHEKELKSQRVVPYERWRKGHKKTGVRPPYGFCFLQGEVVRDPKEYPTLLLMHNLWTRGSGNMSILAAPFGIDSPFLVHLPLVCSDGEWRVALPQELAQNDLRNSAAWFDKCDKTHAKKAGVERGTLFESLNYNNKLLVQNPSARRWIVFNAAGTNVSAATVENTELFWADQRTYWYCPSSKAEGDFLAAILNAPSLNLIIKPFQSVGLAGERDIHKKILELLPKYDGSNSTMAEISKLGAEAKTSVDAILATLKGKGIVTKRKTTRDHIQKTLNLIDKAVKDLIQIKG